MKHSSNLRQNLSVLSSILCASVLLCFVGSASAFHTHSSLLPVKYCPNVTLEGDDCINDFEKLKECHVIEGHLHLSHCTLPMHASLPNLTQVLDFVLLEYVRGVTFLSDLFPRLAVIRGQRLLFNSFAFVLYANRDLKEVGEWSMREILRGSVALEENVLLCTDENLHWKNLTKDTQQRPPNHFNNNREFCPFLECEKSGICEERERACLSTGLSCPIMQDMKCHEECLGGCTHPKSAFHCVACKHFLLEGQCVAQCPRTYLKYMNYRCISPSLCHNYKFAVGYRKELISPEISSCNQDKDQNDLECIPDCPEKFVQESSEYTKSIVVRTCKPRLECETSTITDRNLGYNLRYCTRIEGSLIIHVSGNKKVTEALERNLEKIETITGYLKVVGSSSLFSLSFLKNLLSIEGKEAVYEGGSRRYVLYILENPNLKELWDWKMKPIPTLSINGSAFIHFNDRLCETQMENLVARSSLSYSDISAGFNGKQSLCDVFYTYLKAVPGSTPGTIELSWMHTYCGVDERYVSGYRVFYRPTQENVSLYQGRDVCSKETVWCVDTIELELSYEDWKCISHTIKGLMPHTRYAIYVESSAVNVYTKHSIRSEITYVTTYDINPGSPSKGTIEFKENEMMITWEGPSLPPFSSEDDLRFELEITLEDDRIPRSIRFNETCQISSHITDEPSEEQTPFLFPHWKITTGEGNCRCCLNTSNPVFNPEDVKRTIQIGDEDKRLTYVIRIPVYGLRERRSVPSDYYNRTTACKEKRAPKDSCTDPVVLWHNSNLSFSTQIFPSPWKLGDGNIYLKNASTKERKLRVTFPAGFNFMSAPRKVSVKIRSCLGRMERCVPLNLSTSCSLCSNFYSWSNHSVHFDGAFPKFEVTPVQFKKTKNNFKENDFECSKQDAGKFFHKPEINLLSNIEGNFLKTSGVFLTNSSLNDVSDSGVNGMDIVWDSLPDLENVTLGYRIQLQRVHHEDINDQQTIQICLPKSIADERGNRFTIPIKSEKMFLVGLEVRTLAGYSPLKVKCVKIPWNENNNVSGYLGLFAVCFIGILVIGIFYFICMRCKGVCNERNKGSQIYNLYYGGKLRPIQERYRLKFNHLEFSRILGGGKYGIVFEGKITDKISGEKKQVPVAVKTILEDKRLQEFRDLLQKQAELRDIPKEEKSKLEEEILKIENLPKDKRTKVIDKKMNELLQEAITMQNFDSFFVVKLVGVAEHARGISATSEPSFYVALEYMDRDLKTYLKSLEYNNGALTEEEKIEIAVQVADGMLYLSKKGFVHRDLAARNILIQLRNNSDSTEWEPHITIKIGDFGLTRYFKTDYYYRQKVGCYLPVPHSAPEVISYGRSSGKSDIWSYGAVIYEIVNNGEVPRDLYKKVDEGLQVIPNGTSEFFASVITQCLQNSPKDRPPFIQFVRSMLPRTSENFQKWFQKKSYFHRSMCFDSKSTEGSDEGFPSSSLDASQDENDFTASLTTAETIRLNDEEDNDDEENEEDEEDDIPDDDNACLTPQKYGREQSSCMSLNCVHNSISCRRKRFSVSGDALSFH